MGIEARGGLQQGKMTFCGLGKHMYTLHDRHMNGPWFDHVLEWWEAANADPEHILFLHYEAMLAAPQEHIRKIADFASIDHTPEILEKASGVDVGLTYLTCVVFVLVLRCEIHTTRSRRKILIGESSNSLIYSSHVIVNVGRLNGRPH